MALKLPVKQTWDSAKGLAGPFGAIGGIGGFVADVLQPLAPFAQILFYTLFPLGVLIFLSSLAISRGADLPSKLRQIGLALSISGLAVGIVALLQGTQNATENGVLAAKIEWVEELQKSIGLIKADISDIKQSTGRIESVTQSIDQRSLSIQKDVSELADSIAGIGHAGGLILDPQNAVDHYYNAIVNQERGNFAEARREFNQYFEKEGTVSYDAAIAYRDFLISIEGRGSATESLRAQLADFDSVALTAVLQTMEAPEIAASQLVSSIEKNPEHGPINYLIADQYSSIRLGNASLADQRKEREYLEKFLTAYQDGKVISLFVNKNTAREWAEDAQKRISETESISNLEDIGDVAFDVLRSNNGYSITISLAEPATEILYRESNNSRLTSTGTLSTIDPRTGKLAPNPSLSVGSETDLERLEVYYKDRSGSMQGPFKLPLEENSQSLESTAAFSTAKRILDVNKKWISINPKNITYTSLVMTRCAIDSVKYSYGDESLDKSLAIPECDPNNPMRIDANTQTYFENDTNGQDVFVQIIYADGSASEVRKFVN